MRLNVKTGWAEKPRIPSHYACGILHQLWRLQGQLSHSIRIKMEGSGHNMGPISWRKVGDYGSCLHLKIMRDAAGIRGARLSRGWRSLNHEFEEPCSGLLFVLGVNHRLPKPLFPYLPNVGFMFSFTFHKSSDLYIYIRGKRWILCGEPGEARNLIAPGCPRPTWSLLPPPSCTSLSPWGSLGGSENTDDCDSTHSKTSPVGTCAW